MYLPQNQKRRYNCIDNRGIIADNQLHYRGKPSTRCCVPAVLPQDLRGNPRYYRSYRGITDVSITVLLSSSSHRFQTTGRETARLPFIVLFSRFEGGV